MSNAAYILWIVQIIIAVLILCLALLYSIPVILIRRLHKNNTLLTLNLSLITAGSVCYWILYFALFEQRSNTIISKRVCAFINIVQMLATIQVIFSIVTVSLHRCFLIIFHTKVFFRSKRWIVTCLLGQWILALIVSSLTLLSLNNRPVKNRFS